MVSPSTTRLLDPPVVRIMVLALWLQVVTSSGCEPIEAPRRAPARASVPVISEVTADAAVKLRIAKWHEYESAVAGHHDQVLLVDFWATWCVPCREQLRHTLALQRRFGDRGVTVMTVSVDQQREGESLAQLEQRVHAYLTRERATVENLLIPVVELAAGDPAALPLLSERLELPGGSLPHLKLYDRKGTLVRSFFRDPDTGKEFSLTDVEAAIERLAGPSSP